MFRPHQHLPRPGDPFRNPGWRWARSGYLLEHGRRPLRHDDALTAAAWSFRRELDRCRDDAGRRRLADGAPAMAQAHAVFTAADPLRRAELEGRILGGDDDATVGGACGLPAAAVGRYAGVFFDVRDRLRSVGFVLGTVLGGGRLHHALDPQDHPLLVKLFGYAGGGLMVDVMLDLLRNPPAVPADLRALDLPALQALSTKLRLQQLVLMLATPALDLPPAQWWAMRPAPAGPPPAPPLGGDLASPLASVGQTLAAVAALSGAARGSRAA